MNCALCVGTPPTFETVDGVWGSVGYIWQYLDRDQVDTPELCSNKSVIKTAYWGYANTDWSELYPTCGSGKVQSPIDVQSDIHSPPYIVQSSSCLNLN
jgi:hypothetical protein